MYKKYIFKGTVKVKGRGLKPKKIRTWSRPILVVFDVAVLRNLYKTCIKIIPNMVNRSTF